jgi:hypothetical protein
MITFRDRMARPNPHGMAGQPPASLFFMATATKVKLQRRNTSQRGK